MTAEHTDYVKLRAQVATWVAPDQDKRTWLRLLTLLEQSEAAWAESHARLEVAIMERKRTVRLLLIQVAILLAMFLIMWSAT